MNNLQGKRILVGVSGGIAIYKTLTLLSLLNKAGAETKVIMTEGAQAFVRPLTFQTMSKHRVYCDPFAEEDGMIPHIDLSKQSDLFLIAPATANIMAKMAHGIADDLLSSAALAAHCPVAIAPAMNVRMYEHPATQENLKILKGRGVMVIEPGCGLLACQDEGKGRMEEPENMLLWMEQYFTEKDLCGCHLLVTAGATRQPLDPVRFLTNESTGKQGVAIAKRAMMRGANVTLVHGHMDVAVPQGVESVSIKTTEEMLQALEDRANQADALIMAAAPCDYRPKEVAAQKIKKKQELLNLPLEKTQDILKELAKKGKPRIRFGFAAETQNVIAYAQTKRREKKLDMIVANDVSQKDAGFGTPTNRVHLIDDEVRSLPLMDKEAVADVILDCLKEKWMTSCRGDHAMKTNITSVVQDAGSTVDGEEEHSCELRM